MKRKRSPNSEAVDSKNVEIVHEEGKYRVYVQENGKKIVFGKYEDEDGAKEAKLKLLSKNSLTTPQKKVVNAQKKKICSGQAGVRWLLSEKVWLGEFHHAGIRFILGKFDNEAEAIKEVRHKRISIGMDPGTNATVSAKWRRRLLPKEDKLSWVAKDELPWKAKLVGVDQGIHDLGEHKHYHDAVKAIMSKRVEIGMSIHELEKKFLTAKDPIRVPPEAKVKPKKLVRPQGEKYDCAKCSVTITKVVDGTDLKGYGSKYANGYVCDQCHRSDATWPMFHCTGCNWDSCMKCLKKSNEKVNCDIDKVMCDTCGDGGDENLFILCDYVEHRTKCGTIRKVKDHGCHLRCVGLTKIPKGDWYCPKHSKFKPECQPKKKKKKTKKDVKEEKPKPSVPVKKTRKQVQIVPKASSAKGKVEWIPEDSSWKALIWVGKKEEDLGEFRSEEDAVETLRTRQHVLGINDFDFKITIKRGKNWKDKQDKKEKKEAEAAKKKQRKKFKKKKKALTSGSLIKKKRGARKNAKPIKFEGMDSDSSSDDDDNETIQYKDWNSAGKANKIKQEKKQKEKIKIEKAKPKPKPKPPRKKKTSQRQVAHELFTLQQKGPRAPPKSRKRREADKPLLPRKRRRSVTLVSRLLDALPRGCQQYENKFIDEGFGDADVWEACLEEGNLGPKIKDPMHKNLIMRKMKKIYKDLKAQGNWNN